VIRAADDCDLIVERVAETIGVVEAVAGHRATFWAIRRFFEELAKRRPLIVVFDDIQWAEPTFLDLVEAIGEQSRKAQLLLVCMARPDLLEVRPTWAEADQATSLHLMPLTDDASARLIANLLGAPNLAEEVRTRIIETAEGNPLFVEEIVSMLIDQGLLLRRDGSVAASGEWSRVSLPPTIQALLAARLDGLAREERAVLERGSIEGKVFHRGAVLALSPEIGGPGLDERLRTLAQQELIQPGRAEFPGEKAFRFRHQLLRDVAYASLSKADRAELHERFAAWLEAKTGNRAEGFEEISGYHLQEAYRYKAALGPVDDRGRELATRAANHLGIAGSRAYARGDMWGAGKLLSRTLGLLPKESADRQGLQRKLDDALFETGQQTRALGRASLRCFWHWPLGHRWEFKESAGKPMLRCVICGKASRGPRGWTHLRDNPEQAQRRAHERAAAAGGGDSVGGDGGDW
jgi:predicted ATPase